MKNLLLILSTVFALTFTSESFAQKFFTKAGLNYSSQLFKSDIKSYGEGISWKPGFSLGVTASIPITKILSLETGLSLQNKGYKQNQKQGGALDVTDVKNIVNLYYLELPLDAKVLINIGKMNFFGVFGPYIGMGLWGKTKGNYLFRGEPMTENKNINWGSNSVTDNYTRLDFGLNAGVGIEYKSFQIGLGYGLGLLNISPNTSAGQKINNKAINIYLAYKLGER
jgi:hypothetical protein